MIISVASGKGGTGKTMVATNLASVLGLNVQVLDCDVEEPNAHLFLHPVWESKQTVTTFVPSVDEEKCTHCGECAEFCRFKALAVLKEITLVFDDLCHGCRGCLELCPTRAISRGEREVGVVATGWTEGIELVHGRLRIGEAMAPPLIRAVKERLRRTSTVIVDAPPGTSCPVIAAMKDSDCVVLVTEPTPFGLHDFKLALEAVRVMGLRHGLVINRSDVGTDDLRRFAEEENIPILLEIPFGRDIAEAYARGELVVDAVPGMRERFLELWTNIRELVDGERRGS